MNSPTRSITVANQHPRLRIDARAVSRAIGILDAEFAGDRTSGGRERRPTCPAGELSVVFLTDEALAGLHARFLDDPSITDVITFEGDPALGVAGEVCVSADAAARQTSAGRRTHARSGGRDAFARELTLYVVHGWLHLAGYDDLQPAKKRMMRRAEARAMRLLDRHKAVPQSRLR